MSLRQRLTNAAEGAVVSAPRTTAQLDDVKRRLHATLIDEMGGMLDTGDAAFQRVRLESTLRDMLDRETTPLSLADRNEVVADVLDNVLGYGPIEPFLADAEVSEIMVNGPDTIFIERSGKIHPTGRRFLDEQHLLHVIDKIVGQVGRRIDESTPMVDARLQDGSRVNAVIHPLAINGPMLTIRKFSADPYTVRDLIGFGTLSAQAATFLEACVRGRLNVIISGGTGTGKTTLLNVLSGYVPSDERVITIEDAAELQLHQQHVLRLESRPANIEGRGEVTIRDLVRNSLRMRPDRIVVGEVRGGEALDMLQAMNTGHDGSLSTVHANTPRDALSRLETMVLLSGVDLPSRAVREQLSSALNLIVQIARLRDGSRRIVEIAEVQNLEGELIVLQELFKFDFSAGLDSDGRFRGKLRATGARPLFERHLADVGVMLPAGAFAAEEPAQAWGEAL